MNTKIFILTAAATALILAAGCSKNEEDTYSTQETYIESLVTSLTSSNDTATVEYFDGPVRVTVAGDGGTALESGGSVTFLYALHYLSSASISASNLVATNSADVADQYGWDLTDTTVFQPATLNLATDDIVTGLRKALPGVEEGDECYIMFSGKYGLGKRQVASVPKNSALVYHLWISGVSN